MSIRKTTQPKSASKKLLPTITQENIMNLRVAKWGNSLALRLPAEYVRSIGIKEGDRVEACLTVDGGLTIRPATWNRKAFSRKLAAARETMPMDQSVMDELRRGGRY